MRIELYEDNHFDGIVDLWAESFPDDPPWNDPIRAIPEKERVQPGLFFVAVEDGEVIGTTMAGYDGHRGWLYAVVVKPSHRGRGIGAALVKKAEQALEERGCVKLNLQVRDGNHGAVSFYDRLGYAVEPRVSMGKKLGAFAD